MIYDSSGELIEYRYYLGMEGFISHTKVPIDKYSAKLDDDMTYYTKIDKKNNYILDYDGDKVDTIKEFYFVRGIKELLPSLIMMDGSCYLNINRRMLKSTLLFRGCKTLRNRAYF